MVGCCGPGSDFVAGLVVGICGGGGTFLARVVKTSHRWSVASGPSLGGRPVPVPSRDVGGTLSSRITRQIKVGVALFIANTRETKERKIKRPNDPPPQGHRFCGPGMYLGYILGGLDVLPM